MDHNTNIYTFLNGRGNNCTISITEMLSDTTILKEMNIVHILEEFNQLELLNISDYLYEDSHNYQIIDINY